MPKKIINVSDYSPKTLLRIFYECKHTGIIPDDINNQMARHFPQYDPIMRSMPPRGYKNKSKYNKSKSASVNAKTLTFVAQNSLQPVKGMFIVTVKQSVNRGITYNDVLVNGKYIVKNAMDIELKTFMDDTLLGLRYTNSNGGKYWRLYNADVHPILIDNESQWNIERINCADDMLYAYTDLHAQITISRQSIMRNIAKVNHYVIQHNNGR